MNLVAKWLGRLPVRVRRGLARGAWWSVYPCSSYWRLGGNDAAVEAILSEHAAHPGLVCWDVGAHFGIYAVGLARAVGPHGRIEAFEPDPVSFGRLAWHRKINRLENLRLHEAAASDSTGRARIYQYEGFGSTSTHLRFPGEALVGAEWLEIITVRLDEWLACGRLRAPNFIKIDVEGHGTPALRGMTETFSRHKPKTLIAVHTEEEHKNAREFFSLHGYSVYPLPSADGRPLQETHFGELLALPPP